MEGTPAVYLGKIVDKTNFRTFIYGANGQKRLVESWNEFEAAMESGIWFAVPHDAAMTEVPVTPVESDESVVVEEKPKPKLKAKGKPKSRKLDEMVFEVKDGE